MSRTRVAAVAGAVLALIPVASARADPDYDPSSSAWNGLSTLVELAEDEGVPLRVPSALDLGGLTPRDAVLVIYPNEELPVGSLAEFMRDGGRVGLADDYGRGDELLEVYRIGRLPADPDEAPQLRGNPNLPVARPMARHTLTYGLTAVVTNHATTLYHAELDPLLAYDDSGRGVVVAGAVGEGRLVAVGDPSALINNMLELRDNERFARNLLRYLSEQGGTLYLAAPGTSMVGRYGEPGSGRAFHDLRSWLEELAGADAPPLALLLGAIVIASIMLVVATTSLPRRSPYDGSSMFGPAPAAGGFVGRVGYFQQPSANLLHPLMVYKFELEGEIVRHLGLSGRTLLKDVLAGLRERGLPEAEVAEARELLLELDELRDRQDRPPGPPRVTAARFRAMVATGERLVERLDASRGARPYR